MSTGASIVVQGLSESRRSVEGVAQNTFAATNRTAASLADIAAYFGSESPVGSWLEL